MTMKPHTLCLLAFAGAISVPGTYAAPFKLPDLPYDYDALELLEPTISKRTLTTHHTKHHAK